MKNELEKKLIDTYSSMFANYSKPPTQTCMCWGVSCDDGWYHILDHMCRELDNLQKKYDINIIFDQIKEKFGTLRVYSHFNLGPRWTKDDETALLDGKPEIELIHFGWSHYGETVPAYKGIQDRIDEIINMAEIFSHVTCEKCGMTGATAREGGWIHTYCDVCEAKYTAKDDN